MLDVLYALLVIVLVKGALASKPPQDVLIIYPSENANLGQNVTVGIGELGSYDGLNRNISISMIAPNGSNVGGVWTESPSDQEHGCLRGNGTYGAYNRVDQAGTYVHSSMFVHLVPYAQILHRWTVAWGVRYGISSDSSKANASYCGPAPLSFQTWTFNATFNVQDMGLQREVPMHTASTKLSPQPTGSVKEIKNSGRSIHSTFTKTTTLTIALFVLML